MMNNGKIFSKLFYQCVSCVDIILQTLEACCQCLNIINCESFVEKFNLEGCKPKVNQFTISIHVKGKLKASKAFLI